MIMAIQTNGTRKNEVGMTQDQRADDLLGRLFADKGRELEAYLGGTASMNVFKVGVARFLMTCKDEVMNSSDLRKKAIMAITHAAKMGLVPDGDECAIVYIRNDIKIFPMIGGYKKLAYQTGRISRIDCRIVWNSEALSDNYFMGTPKLDLGKNITPKGVTFNTPFYGILVGIESSGKPSDREIQYYFLDYERIMANAKVGMSDRSSAWANFPIQMFEKTAIRIVLKEWIRNIPKDYSQFVGISGNKSLSADERLEAVTLHNEENSELDNSGFGNDSSAVQIEVVAEPPARNETNPTTADMESPLKEGDLAL